MQTDHTPQPPPTAPQERPVIAQSGRRYSFGYADDFVGVWDQRKGGPPVARFPRTDEGWQAGWDYYSGLENSSSPDGSWSAGPAPRGWTAAPAKAPWIIAGGIVLASVIVAVAIVSGRGSSAPDGGTSEPILPGAEAAAQDRAAQANLRNAIAAAKVYFTDGDTYTGFDPIAAASIEPSLTWTGDDPAFPGMVSINVASGNEVVLSTLSSSGQPFCIADSANVGITFGRVDGSFEECLEPSW